MKTLKVFDFKIKSLSKKVFSSFGVDSPQEERQPLEMGGKMAWV